MRDACKHALGRTPIPERVPWWLGRGACGGAPQPCDLGGGRPFSEHASGDCVAAAARAPYTAFQRLAVWGICDFQFY